MYLLNWYTYTTGLYYFTILNWIFWIVFTKVYNLKRNVINPFNKRLQSEMKFIESVWFTGLNLLFHLATLARRSDLRLGNQLHSEQVRRLDSIPFHFIETFNKYTTMKCFENFFFFSFFNCFGLVEFCFTFTISCPTVNNEKKRLSNYFVNF